MSAGDSFKDTHGPGTFSDKSQDLNRKTENKKSCVTKEENVPE